MYADPVIGESFFGRDEILELLNKRIEALKGGYRQNIAITGQRLCGKTSLIHHFVHTLKDDNIIPVYVEIADESFENFVDKFIGTLLYNFFKTYIDKVPEDITGLLDSQKNLMPKTIESIQKIRLFLKEDKFEEAFTLLFNLTSIIRDETGKSCIVILDEFHNLDLFHVKNPFANFGKRIMIQKDTMYIVASSEVNKIKKILSEKLALLFGNFEKIELDAFDSKMSKEFIRKRLNPIKAQEDIINFIVYFVDGHPYYLDVIVDKLNTALSSMKFKIITKNILFDILTDELFNSKGTFNQYFMNSIASFQIQGTRRFLSNVTLSLAEGNYKIKDISSSLPKGEKDITKKLDRLDELNFISKKGIFYRFNDRVMEFWLKNIYNRKQKSYITNIEEQIQNFKNNLNRIFVEFTENSKNSITARIEALLRCFNNEIVEIDKKSHKLPRFSSIACLDESKPNFITCLTDSGKKWIFIIEDKEIKEQELLYNIGFINAQKDISKIVLVSLVGLDANARLVAKESKMWIWELEDINYMMDVYKRYRIVL